MTKVYVPGAVGVPDRTPAPVRVRPGGSEPVLTAEDADRWGYVPNVVYTCGLLAVGQQLLIPYGISDSAVGFATVSMSELRAVMD